MRELGVNAYQFSTGWSRDAADGRGAPQTKAGLAFYDRLVDGLLRPASRRSSTLNHWGPAAGRLDEGRVGLAVDAFVAYADVLSRRPRRPREALDHATGLVRRDAPARAGQRARARPADCRAGASRASLLLARPRRAGAAPRTPPGAEVELTTMMPAPGGDGRRRRSRCGASGGTGLFNPLWFLDPTARFGRPADVIADHHPRHRRLATLRSCTGMPRRPRHDHIADGSSASLHCSRAVLKGRADGASGRVP